LVPRGVRFARAGGKTETTVHRANGLKRRRAHTVSFLKEAMLFFKQNSMAISSIKVLTG